MHRDIVRVKLFSSNNTMVFLIRGCVVNHHFGVIFFVHLHEVLRSINVLVLLVLGFFRR